MKTSPYKYYHNVQEKYKLAKGEIHVVQGCGEGSPNGEVLVAW